MCPQPIKMDFRYLRDPIFLSVAAAYVVNRLMVKPYFPNVISSSYLNDLICIPFCLPIMLWGMKKAGWRKHDCPPQPAEIMISILIWAVAFELIIPELPIFRGRAISDPMDIPCYIIGALLASIAWDWIYRSPRASETLTETEVSIITDPSEDQC